jgi:hypothetical protein
MRLSAVDHITPSGPIDQLPIRLELAGSRGSFMISLLMAVPVALFLITPFVLVGSFAALEPEAFLKVSMSWQAGLQLGVALAAALVLTAFAMRRVANSWGRKATVEIGYGVVAVVERRFGLTRRWTAPVSDFLGLAHNVRSSLSGARHELVLVHPDAANSVLLHLAPTIPQPHIDRVAILLGVSEIPARALVRQSTMPRLALPSAKVVPALPAPTPVPALPQLDLAPASDVPHAKLQLVA